MPNSFQISLENHDHPIKAIAYGDANKTLILALHGWLDNADSFALLAPLLKDYYIIAIDFPGHGLSLLSKNEEPFSMQFYVNLLAEVINHLTNQPIILMGHSMGGAIASVYTAQNPSKISKLILIDVLGPLSSDTLAAYPSIETNAKKMQVAALHASDKTYSSLEDMISIRMKANHLSHEQAKAMTERGACATEQGFKWRYDKRVAQASAFYFTEEEVLQLLAKISCPILIIAGSEGIFKGRDFYQQRLEVMPNHILQFIEGHHHIHLEKAEETAKSINTFLNSL